MKSIKKLDLKQFNRFELLTSHLKSLTGGGQVTSRSGTGTSDGPDLIDECTGHTRFSNGSTSDDTIRG